MAPDKLLAEWFWIDRWDGSSGQLLPMEARGLYREMLTQAWRRGARLPKNETSIQRAVRCTTEEWDRSWPLVRPYWRADGDWISNDTQREIYADAMARAEAASERGRKGAQARAQALAQAKLGQVLETKPPSPSPSPSPSLTPSQETDPPKPPAGAGGPGRVTPGDVLRLLGERWPNLAGSREGQRAVKRRLRAVSADKVMAELRGCASPPEWLVPRPPL